ncbi:tetratricopeptide repeat protein [Bacteroidota bacterium]
MKSIIIINIMVSLLIMLSSCNSHETSTELTMDSDGDGWTDALEQKAGTDPSRKDTDNDGYWDSKDPNPLDSNIPVSGSVPSPAVTPIPSPTATQSPPQEAVPTYQLNFSDLQIGNRAAMHEISIRKEEMQNANDAGGSYGPNPGKLIPKGVWLILLSVDGNPTLRLSMQQLETPTTPVIASLVKKHIEEKRYIVAIVTSFGEVRFSPEEYEYVKSLPTKSVDDKRIYDINIIKGDANYLAVYERLNPGFTRLSNNENRTRNKETGEFEPDIFKAIASGIPFNVVARVWGITEEEYDKASTVNDLKKLNVIDEKGMISTDGVIIALKAGIEKTELINLGVPRHFIDSAISSTPSPAPAPATPTPTPPLSPPPQPNKEEASFYFKQGFDHYEKGEYEKAIEDYSEAIRLYPQDFAAYYNRGLAYSDLEQFERAIEDYDEAIRILPQYAKYYGSRGDAYARLGFLDASETGRLRLLLRAIEDYSEAIRLDPQFAEAYYNRGYVRSFLTQLEKAIEDYSEAIRLDPQFAEAYYERGYAHSLLTQLEKAIEDYSETIRLNPQDAAAYYNRGFAYKQQGKSAEAIADFKKAIALTDEPRLSQMAQQQIDELNK